jgi:simple sugar transport system ATP-binding protein
MADNGARAAEPCYAAELRNISKIYPGGLKPANNNISLGLRKGEILCIAGENGAGKTTLMKILCGLEAPGSGSICINGKAECVDSPAAARKLGIGMVHQHFMLFPEYTAAENIVMGSEPRKWGVFWDFKKTREAAAAVISAHGFSIEPERPAHTLSVGEMQQVEICRVLYRGADIIVLDEPTSVLAERETAALFETLRALAASGKSIILITHKLAEITQIADRVAVLRGGELAGVRNAAGIDEYEISRLMIGAEGLSGIARNNVAHNATAVRGEAAVRGSPEPVLAFTNVTVMRHGQKQPLLDRLSFTVAGGEIAGFAGVGGNGLGVLEAVLGGFLHPASGKILHRGRDISRLNIRRLRNAGLAYVPADRMRVGCALNAAVSENLIINRRGEFSPYGFLSNKKIARFTDGLVTRYNIAGAAPEGSAVPAASLSGGNLQKLILAREIEQFKDYMVFSEPTWGLDIAAGAFVRGEIAALRARGAALVLISTNLDELLELADRIIVLYRGRAAGEFANPAGTDSALLKAVIGECMQGLPQKGAVPQ